MVNKEELQEALEYLDSFEKGQKTIEIDEEANGGQEEKIERYKEKLNSHIKKAKAYKEALDKLEKGESADVEDEEMETEKTNETEEKVSNKEGEEIEKGLEKETIKEEGLSFGSVEELSKSIEEKVLLKVGERYEDLIKSKDSEIKSLTERLDSLENEPVRKSITKSAKFVVLEKALKGEPTEEGKIVLSKRLQKSKVSDALFSAWEQEKDEVKKSFYADAVAKFESTGSYISPSVVEDLFKSKNIQIID